VRCGLSSLSLLLSVRVVVVVVVVVAAVAKQVSCLQLCVRVCSAALVSAAGLLPRHHLSIVRTFVRLSCSWRSCRCRRRLLACSYADDPFEWYYCIQYEVFNDYDSACLETKRVDGLLRRIMRVDVCVAWLVFLTD
jgi:hypothetical protein